MKLVIIYKRKKYKLEYTLKRRPDNKGYSRPRFIPKEADIYILADLIRDKKYSEKRYANLQLWNNTIGGSKTNETVQDYMQNNINNSLAPQTPGISDIKTEMNVQQNNEYDPISEYIQSLGLLKSNTNLFNLLTYMKTVKYDETDVLKKIKRLDGGSLDAIKTFYTNYYSECSKDIIVPESLKNLNTIELSLVYQLLRYPLFFGELNDTSNMNTLQNGGTNVFNQLESNRDFLLYLIEKKNTNPNQCIIKIIKDDKNIDINNTDLSILGGNFYFMSFRNTTKKQQYIDFFGTSYNTLPLKLDETNFQKFDKIYIDEITNEKIKNVLDKYQWKWEWCVDNINFLNPQFDIFTKEKLNTNIKNNTQNNNQINQNTSISFESSFLKRINNSIKKNNKEYKVNYDKSSINTQFLIDDKEIKINLSTDKFFDNVIGRNIIYKNKKSEESINGTIVAISETDISYQEEKYTSKDDRPKYQVLLDDNNIETLTENELVKNREKTYPDKSKWTIEIQNTQDPNYILNHLEFFIILQALSLLKDLEEKKLSFNNDIEFIKNFINNTLHIPLNIIDINKIINYINTIFKCAASGKEDVGWNFTHKKEIFELFLGTLNYKKYFKSSLLQATKSVEDQINKDTYWLGDSYSSITASWFEDSDYKKLNSLFTLTNIVDPWTCLNRVYIVDTFINKLTNKKIHSGDTTYIYNIDNKEFLRFKYNFNNNTNNNKETNLKNNLISVEKIANNIPYKGYGILSTPELKILPYGNNNVRFYNQCTGKNLSDLHIGAEAIYLKEGHVTSDYFSLATSMFCYMILKEDSERLEYKALFDCANATSHSERYYITNINSIENISMKNNNNYIPPSKKRRSNNTRLLENSRPQTVFRPRLPF